MKRPRMTDTYTPQVGAWTHAQPVHDEQNFTPEARVGWPAWNGMSPEVEVVEFFAALVRMLQPELVVETGCGQGYITRAVNALLRPGQQLRSYESNPSWREALEPLPFWLTNAGTAFLAPEETPPPAVMGDADLCFLDSDFEFRFDEIRLWHQIAKPGAVALIHDTQERVERVTMPLTVRELILDLYDPSPTAADDPIAGVFLKNPRGCFLAIHP